VSGRKRFNIVSPQMEQQLAQMHYRQVVREFGARMLPEGHPATRMVQRVLGRLIPAAGMADTRWEVHVIDAPDQLNAFVIPG
jgi:predicted Zn-dependent protease